MLRPPNPAIAVLFACTALASTGMFTAITLGAIAAVEAGGSRATSGFPASLAIFGTAFGSIALGAWMSKRGGRAGMRSGWLVAIAGGILAAVGVELESFLMVLGGMFGIGFGNAGTQLARFAAAETVAPDERGTAVAWTVWAAAVGAMLGPLSLAPTGELARAAGFEPGVGGFVLVAVSFLAASLVVALFRPVAYVAPQVDATVAASAAIAPVRRGARLAPAVGCLVAAQACMVMVMAITPVHLDDGGHAYGVVGTVMSGHFVGMFALAPIIGWLVDRVTPTQAIRVGLMALAVGAMFAALLPVEHGSWLSLPLLLVGLGWCGCFVAASAAVAGAVSNARERGRVDSLTWFGAATSSALSGVLLAAVDYAAVAFVAVAIVTAVAVLVAGRVDEPLSDPR